MKYFLDTEFHEYKTRGVNTIELISIGIVDETGREFYAESRDFVLPAAARNEWLRDNVLRGLESIAFDPVRRLEGIAMPNENIARAVLDFVNAGKGDPEFYGYYADYDWVVFCWLFGRMINLPKGFPMYCRDLKQIVDEAVEDPSTALFIPGLSPFTLEDLKAMKGYPPEPENEHNALADAKWNKALYDFLFELEASAAA